MSSSSDVSMDTSSSSTSSTLRSKYLYAVTAEQPTISTHSLTCNFTSATTTNLIVAKCTHLEIYTLTASGLEQTLDVPLNGRIASLNTYKPNNSVTDLLFLTTDRHQFTVLSYDTALKQVKTVAYGDLRHRIGRVSDSGQTVLIDPKLSCIVVHQYDGILQVLPLDRHGSIEKEAFDVRLDELQIISMCFLNNVQKPTLTVLYQDTKEKRHVKTYYLDLKDKELKKGPWDLPNVDHASCWLIACTLGVLIVGEEVITYYNGNKSATKLVKIAPQQITGWGKIDNSRYLVGNLDGELSMIVLSEDNTGVQNIQLEKLGSIVSPHTITYLDNGYVYIGSVYGDAQLIQLSTEKNEQGSFVNLIDTFHNLGSITDMCIMDLDRQGQGQLVTCSGAYRDGSLRVIRNGVGINEEASIELDGIKGIWSLQPNSSTAHHKMLVQSFVSETRILSIEDEELSEIDVTGFESTVQTLYCGNMQQDVFIQVTASAVRLVDANTLQALDSWQPAAGATITVAHANTTQLLLATSGCGVALLTVTPDRKLQVVKQVTLDREVSCLNITPIGSADNGLHAAHAALGMWGDNTVRVVTVPDLTEVARQNTGEIIPRSLLFTTFEVDAVYLLCGLGDGHLYNWQFDRATQSLQNMKKIALGAQPITLNIFRARNAVHVFASCDRPTVIYYVHGKLLYSNVNLRDVNYMTPFNSALFQDCLAFATETGLTIGHIDDIQKLHIRTFPLHAQPRRIAHQPSSHTLAVIVLKYRTPRTQPGLFESHHIQLYDEQSFELLSSYDLEPNEAGSSITTLKLDGVDHYIVGTAYVYPTDPEPTKGRILVLRVHDKKLELVDRVTVAGSVYAITGWKEKIVAGVNAKVLVFNTQPKLTLDCTHGGNVVVLFLKIRESDDTIAVGDMQKSVLLLQYTAMPDGKHMLAEVAKEYDNNWMTSLDMLNEEIWIGTDSSYNMFMLRRNVEGVTEEDRARLEVVGRYHVADFVNKILPGSLVMNLPDSEQVDKIVPTHVFGTITGMIGVIAPLSKSQYQFFHRLEQVLENTISSVGNLSHATFRNFINERKTEDKLNVIDGDLIEQLLDLPLAQQQVIAKELQMPVQELVKTVEDVSRIH